MRGAGCRVQGAGFQVIRSMVSQFKVSWFRVHGSRFRVHGAGFKVQGSEFRVQGAGCRVQGVGVRGQGFTVQGSGFRGKGFKVQGSGCRVKGVCFNVNDPAGTSTYAQSWSTHRHSVAISYKHVAAV